MPRVSIVIPAYFSNDTVAQTLAALRAQTYRDFEVVIVNSSPETTTQELIRGQFPEVNFEQSPTRLLPHAARNRAETCWSSPIRTAAPGRIGWNGWWRLTMPGTRWWGERWSWRVIAGLNAGRIW